VKAGLAGLPAVALFVAWSLDDGGYAPTAWYPVALLLVGLLATILVAIPGALRTLSHPVIVGLIAFAAYVLLSYGSILWAVDAGAALEGANRTLLFFLIFAVFAVLPWTPTSALTALVGFVVGLTVVGGVTLGRLVAAEDPTAFTIDARLAAPLGYPNATAALWTIAALPALVLAARRSTPVALRPLLLASSGFLFELGILSQSRGWLFTMPVVLLVLLAFFPGRRRLVVFAVPVAIAVALTAPPLLEVFAVGGYREGDERPFEDIVSAMGTSLDAVPRAVGLSFVALLGAGALLCALERVGQRARVALTRVGTGVTVAAVLLAGAASFQATGGDPAGTVSRAWDDFRSQKEVTAVEGSRFTSLGSGRYDFWRVGVEAWREHPIAGIGQDNYAAAYLAAGRTGEEPRWVHSLPLRLLVHTGLVGFVLFTLFAAASLAGVVAGLRHLRGSDDVMIAGAAALPFVVWAVQGSVDWYWEFPALSGPAFGFLAMAAVLGTRRTTPAGSSIPARIPAAAAIAVLIAVLIALVPALSAARDVRAAENSWRTDYDVAMRRLDRAASLNRLSARPPLSEAGIALAVGDLPRASRALKSVLERDPESWFAHFELGLLRSADGDRRSARRHLARAIELKRDDALLVDALARVGTRHPLRLREANERLTERVALRTAR